MIPVKMKEPRPVAPGAALVNQQHILNDTPYPCRCARGGSPHDPSARKAVGADMTADTLLAPPEGASGINGPGNDTPKEATVNLVRADKIKPERIDWVWGGWIARGKMHVIAGAAGTGKTTIALDIAAIITSGGRWPDATPAQVGNVVIWSGEDGLADTLSPRLLAMGADMTRVFFVNNVSDARGQRSLDLASDIELLAKELARTDDVTLLIVDPLVSAVAADSHKNGEVRRALQPLVDLAVAKNCALLGITHYTKNTTGKDPLDRVTGSLELLLRWLA